MLLTHLLRTLVFTVLFLNDNLKAVGDASELKVMLPHCNFIDWFVNIS